ncbi:MAG: translation initiation factor IF-2 [Chloroherpetonaceae bacterium]|nr:translation initiation factor IF-2 [Chloroherpetonaceae bacterium]
MSEEKEVKKYKVLDLADELTVSASDILQVLAENNMAVKSASSKITDEMREVILSHFQAEKKQSDAQKKLRADKEKKSKQLAAKSSGQADQLFDESQKKKIPSFKGEPLFLEKPDLKEETVSEPEEPLPPIVESKTSEVQEAEKEAPKPEPIPEVKSEPLIEEKPVTQAPAEPKVISPIEEVSEAKSAPVETEKTTRPMGIKVVGTVELPSTYFPKSGDRKQDQKQGGNKSEFKSDKGSEKGSERGSEKGSDKATEKSGQAQGGQRGSRGEARPEHKSEHKGDARPDQRNEKRGPQNKDTRPQGETRRDDGRKPENRDARFGQKPDQRGTQKPPQKGDGKLGFGQEQGKPSASPSNFKAPEKSEPAAPQLHGENEDAFDPDSLYSLGRNEKSLIEAKERTKMGGLTVVEFKTREELGLVKKKKKDKKKNLGERKTELQDFVPTTSREVPAAATKKPVFEAASSDQIIKRGIADKQDAGLAAKGKKKKKNEVDSRLVERNIRQTISDMDEVSESVMRQRFRKRRAKEREERQELAAQQAAEDSKKIKITEFASAHEFADKVGVTPKEVIEKCFRMGKFITINQRLDRETIEILALEFGKDVLFVSDVEATVVEIDEEVSPILKTRPPVVTIMGHVDHGKTSLLDYIRRSNVVAGESGGITQHIGAYEVKLESGQSITFLDTPGHEAFTAMRARGAQVTDIVILVVAADDSVMPQTLEAISHAKAANVPLVVAINKIDKPEANPDKIRTQLSENGVLVEEWGGDVQCQEISAKKGLNVRELLDKVLVQSELMSLQADFNEERLARGVVVEAELDRGKGIIATVLIQQGILKIGDAFIAGAAAGKVRALLDERGNRKEVVYPSEPVRVLGFEELPEAGDIFNAMETEREAREIAQRRQLIRREQEFRARNRMKLDEIGQAGIKELRIVLKADVGGSLEALAEGLIKVQNEEVKIHIIHRGIGQISESDVLLAAASDAIIIGFRVRPNLKAKQLAERESIDIRFYTVIYHAIEEVEKALEGMLSPEFKEEVVGTIEIRNVFKISKFGNVAGCFVLDGKISRDGKVRLLRDGVQIYDGELSSLKRFKDDVKEVASGFECGLTLRNYDDVKVGDIVEVVQTVETKRKLATADAR